jgi:hypothetical protein
MRALLTIRHRFRKSARRGGGQPGRGCFMLLALAAGLAAVGCDEKLSSVAGPTPNLEPTFSSIQREIIERADSSGCVNCHKATGVNGGLDLSHDVAYDHCVNVRSATSGAIRIVPGDPDNSYLIHKLEGKTRWPDIKGVQMPRNAPPLTDGQILIIRRWIAMGAPRN